MGIISVDPNRFYHPNSIAFDGSTKMMGNTTNNTLGIANSWTISMWVKPIISAAAKFSLELKNTGSNNDRIAIDQDTTSNIIIILQDSGGTLFKQYSYANLAPPGTWINILFTWDGSTLNLYKNGVLTAATTKTTDNAGTMGTTQRQVSFGALANNSSNAACRIHSCAMWNKVLVQSEITTIASYDGSRIDVRAVQPASLQHWWLLGWPGQIGIDMGIGSPNIDANANSANVTASDTVGDAPVNNNRQFFYGHPFSLNFDGTSKVARNGNSQVVGIVNAWSMMFWLKPTETAFATNRDILQVAQASINQITVQHLGNQGGAPFGVIIANNGGTTFKNYQWNNLLVGNVWQQVIITWDGTNLLLYYNGTLTAPTTKLTDNAGTQGTAGTIGMRPVTFAAVSIGTSLWWQGKMHSAAFWSAPIAQTYINTIYNNGVGYNVNLNIGGQLPIQWWLFGTKPTLITNYINSTTPFSDVDLNLNAVNLSAADITTDFPNGVGS